MIFNLDRMDISDSDLYRTEVEYTDFLDDDGSFFIPFEVNDSIVKTLFGAN